MTADIGSSDAILMQPSTTLQREAATTKARVVACLSIICCVCISTFEEELTCYSNTLSEPDCPGDGKAQLGARQLGACLLQYHQLCCEECVLYYQSLSTKVLNKNSRRVVSEDCPVFCSGGRSSGIDIFLPFLLRRPVEKCQRLLLENLSISTP
jgi:hypothetical protein